MPIDVQLKNLIQAEKILTKNVEQNDFSAWLKETWIPFCIKLLVEGDFLLASYNLILSNKIEQRNDKDEDITLCYEIAKDFIMDLFLECNKEYNWFDLKKTKFIMSYAHSWVWEKVREDHENQYNIVNDKLSQYYDAYAVEWFKNKLNGIDSIAQKKIFYQTALEAFLQEDNIGLFKLGEDRDACIKEQLDTYLNDGTPIFSIIQDNDSIIYKLFINFLKKTHIIDDINIDHDAAFIKELIKADNLSVENHKKLNINYSYQVRNMLSNKNFNPAHKKSLSISLCDTDNYYFKNDNLLPELIVKDIFESIDLFKKKDLLFSYIKKEGVVVNKQWLNMHILNRIDIVNDLLEDKETVEKLKDKYKKNNQFYMSYQEQDHLARDMEDYFQQMTRQSIKDNKEEFIFDDTLPLYQYGKSGIKSYLLGLDDKFKSQLRQNEIAKGYTLYLPNKKLLDSASAVKKMAIRGMSAFLKQKIDEVNDYVFSCQHVVLALSPTVSDQDGITAVSELVQLLDKAKVKEFTLVVKHLEPQHIHIISTALQQVKHTIVRVHVEDAPKQALALEAINDRAHQIPVSYYGVDNANPVLAKEDISQQPQPVTLAKIKVLMDNVIELKPVETKIGIQYQHQYEHDVEQQTEIQIQQSWQIQDAKEVKQETGFRYGVISGDEMNSLISWQDIEAAYDSTHADYQSSRHKLGEEILNYRYKGRDLKDLWQRLAGNLEVTQQHVIKDYYKDYEFLRHYSRYIPKQISYKTLLNIVRHPHLFQDGIPLDTLPESFGFECLKGALFTMDKYHVDSQEVKPDSFRLKINAVAKAAMPSAEHSDLLKNSILPSAAFYQNLTKVISEYQSWHVWRRAFVSLNLLNDQGVKKINELVNQFMQNAEDQSVLALNYSIQLLNYYYYQKVAKQQTLVMCDQLLFEYQENECYKKGEMFSLSNEQMSQLPIDRRQQIHNGMLDVLNNIHFFNNGNIHHDTQDSYRELLKSIIHYHQEQLPDDIKKNNIIKQNDLSRLLDAMNQQQLIKLGELGVSQDNTRIFTMVAMLHDVERVWGNIGLTDFICCFLSPAINAATLTDQNGQLALQQLLQLSAVEYHWWQQLTWQHSEQSGFADFPVLMTAFQRFLAELSELGIRDALYMPCPLQGINNLQVALSRVVSVLKAVKKPAEQLHNLAGLDWSVSGVALAAVQTNYQFLNADMKLNAAGESLLNIIQNKYRGYTSAYMEHFQHYDAKPYWSFDLEGPISSLESHLLSEAVLLCFYRYIGYQQYAAPMLVYKKLLDSINLPQSYSVIKRIRCMSYCNGKLITKPVLLDNNSLIISQILPILAYATTGQRGLDSLPQQEGERAAQLRRFIEAAYEYARTMRWDRDKEMEAMLNKINAVSEEDLRSVLHDCVELCKHNEKEGKLSLNLSELTQVLTWCIKSRDAELILSKRDDNSLGWMCDASPKEGEFTHPFNSRYLKHTADLLATYNQYLLDAFSRISHYNQETNYASFVSVCLLLDKRNFSFENKGRLLRIISLIHFKYETIFADAYCVIDFLERLSLYQQKASDKALDTFLSALSSLVPNANSQPFSIEKVQTVLEACIQQTEMNGNIDIREFVLSHCNDFHLDPEVDDIKDADFYRHPNELEKQFAGLGVFYKLIKSIMLVRYPVLFGENKELTWKHFLRIIQDVNGHEQQEKILQMLLVSPHSHVDLNTLNLWLDTLLSKNVFAKDSHIPPTLFQDLSVDLIKHQDRVSYIDLLNRWLQLNRWSSEKSYRGFVHLLNKIACMNHSDAYLNHFYDVAFELELLSCKDDYPWYNDIAKLIDIAEKRHISIESLDKLFLSLKFFCDTDRENNQDKHHTPEFKHFLQKWLDNIEETFDLTYEIAEKWDKDNPQRSYHQLLILAQVKELDLDHVYQFLVNMSDGDLVSLASVYQLKPIPSHHLLARMLKNELNVFDFIKCHIADPHDERLPAKLKQQFNDDELWPYINRAKHWQEGESCLVEFAKELPTQLKYSNHLGREEYRFLSLAVIRQKLYDCKQLLSEATTQDEKLTAYLTAFALIREAINKTSVAPVILWPKSVQTLAVLCFINQTIKNNTSSSLFLQLATGEGKSLLAVMLAIMTWLKGEPVTVVTHRAFLASRDVTVYTPLFTALGIECEHLTADNYRIRSILRKFSNPRNLSDNKPEFDGIYYAEFNDMALIRQQHILDTGEDINHMSFILDEADEIILHNQTDSNLTATTGGLDVHPHAFVFEGLAAYLDKLDISKPPINVRVGELVGFLCMTYPLATNVCQDPDFLSMLPVYLKAAWQARTLKENVDFIADEESDYAAVIIKHKPMPSNVTFNGLIQQALHGRLNNEARIKQIARQLTIAPESILFSSMSPEAVLRWMQQSGSLTALSATIGSNTERLEMNKNYGFNYIKLPKMQSSLRENYPVEFCQNRKKQLQAIAYICKSYTDNRTPSKSRAILIVVDSIELAEKLKEQLLKSSNKIKVSMLHAGVKDLSDEALSQVERDAGQANHILIAMSGLISRGFDIKLSSAKQLVVITTYLKNGVDEIQVAGRAGRVNQTTGMRDKGKFYAVYDLETELGRFPTWVNNIQDLHINPEAFKQRQYFSHYRQESVIRLHRQLLGISKNIIQNHFYSLWSALFKNQMVIKMTREQVLKLFTETLDAIASYFSTMTETGSQAQHDYNTYLVQLYGDMLNKLPAMIGNDAPVNVSGITSDLLKEIENQQNQLLMQHTEVLKIGSDKPAIKIHHQWKKGVKFNAYLYAGTQSWGNYFVETVNAMMLAKEHAANLQPGKIALKNRLIKKQQKKSDFLTQLKQIIDDGQLEQGAYQSCLAIYNEKLAACNTEKSVSLSQLKDTMINEETVNCIKKDLGNRQSIIFVHDPLLNNTCEIHLIARELNVFAKLQDAIHLHYQMAHIEDNLSYRVSKENDGYRLILDFSGHQFDVINRQQLFSRVSSDFDVMTDAIFENKYKPSITAMQKIVSDIYELFKNTTCHTPIEINTLFRASSFHHSRAKYDKNVFKPLLGALQTHYATFPHNIKQCIDALLRYDQELFYQNQSGQKCHAYPTCFESLEELLRMDNKRQALQFIQNQIEILIKNKYKDSLLCSYQADCLNYLSKQIVISSVTQSLQLIYEAWQHRKIQFGEENIIIAELMQRRINESHLLFKSVSPDMSIVCQQIRKLIQDQLSFTAPIERVKELTAMN